jgi:hypothetical protein
VLAGDRAYNAEQLEHHQAAVSVEGYLHSGDFIEATFENRESEFLQMGCTGSSESKPIDATAPQDEDPRTAAKRTDVPWLVRGGLTVPDTSPLKPTRDRPRPPH